MSILLALALILAPLHIPVATLHPTNQGDPCTHIGNVYRCVYEIRVNPRQPIRNVNITLASGCGQLTAWFSVAEPGTRVIWYISDQIYEGYVEGVYRITSSETEPLVRVIERTPDCTVTPGMGRDAS